MKKGFYLLISIILLSLIIAGCSEFANITIPRSESEEAFTLLTEGSPLYAGQDILVGEVIVSNDDKKLCVTYELSKEAVNEGWLIYETHLAIAPDISGIPATKKGAPIPGQFPYGDDGLNGVKEYKECIPFEELGIKCGAEIVIAAHAVVKSKYGDETAWGSAGKPGDFRFVKKGDWATYFKYTVECPEQQYTLTLISDPSEGGHVVVEESPDGINDWGQYTFSAGEEIFIGVMQNKGYKWGGFAHTGLTEDDLIQITGPTKYPCIKFRMPAHDVTITANFTVDPGYTPTYWIETNDNYNNDWVKTSGDGNYSEGDMCTVTANSFNGSTYVKYWIEGAWYQGRKINEEDILAEAEGYIGTVKEFSYTFEVTGNRTLTAIFEEIR